MKIPEDSSLLKLAVAFVSARLKGNEAKLAALVSTNDSTLLKTIRETTAKHAALLDHWTFAHALIAPKSSFVCKFKSPDNPSFSLTEVARVDDGRIVGYEATTEGDPKASDGIKCVGLTPTSLMVSAIEFTVADAVCDMAAHPPYLADNATAFGVAVGKQAVLDYKAKWFASSVESDSPAYYLRLLLLPALIDSPPQFQLEKLL